MKLDLGLLSGQTAGRAMRWTLIGCAALVAAAVSDPGGGSLLAQAEPRPVAVHRTASVIVQFLPPDGRIIPLSGPSGDIEQCARQRGHCQLLDPGSGFDQASSQYLKEASQIFFGIFQSQPDVPAEFVADLTIVVDGEVDLVSQRYVSGQATATGTLRVDGNVLRELTTLTPLAGLSTVPLAPQFVRPTALEDHELEINCHKAPGCAWVWAIPGCVAGGCTHIVEWPVGSGNCWDEICDWWFWNARCGCKRNQMVECPPH